MSCLTRILESVQNESETHYNNIVNILCREVPNISEMSWLELVSHNLLRYTYIHIILLINIFLYLFLNDIIVPKFVEVDCCWFCSNVFYRIMDGSCLNSLQCSVVQIQYNPSFVLVYTKTFKE